MRAKETYHLDNSSGFSGAHFHEMDKTLLLDKYNKASDASLLSSSNRDRLQDLYPIVQSNQEKLHVPAHITHEIPHDSQTIKQINHKPILKMRKRFDTKMVCNHTVLIQHSKLLQKGN